MHFSQLSLLSALASFATSAAVTKPLKWTNCTSDDPPNLSCTSLQVPIDWSEPNGQQFSMHVTRVAANDTKNKIGSLFYQPGGPGIAASDELLLLTSGLLFPPQFDLIVPDTRGIGKSHPIRCDPEIWNQVVSNQPTSQASFEQLIQHNRALSESCRNLTGPLLGHIDASSTAKDFDALRSALGEDKITYLGMSYGTVIGQAYAELFPNRIRAMALDGNLDHSLSATTSLALEVASYENVFERFTVWCEDTPSCPLHGEDVKQIFQNVTTEADAHPIPAPECQKDGLCRPYASSWDIRYNFQNLLVFKAPPKKLQLPDWTSAAFALKQAAAGNATLLSRPLAKTPDDPNIWGNGIAQLCLDWNHTVTDFSDMVYLEQMTKDIAPYTLGASEEFWSQSACIDWVEPVAFVPHTIYVTGTPPILLTNAYHDPETPYVEANGLMAQIENAVLVTRKGDGHTSYFLDGATHDAINEYLVTVKTPPPNTVLDS